MKKNIVYNGLIFSIPTILVTATFHFVIFIANSEKILVLVTTLFVLAMIITMAILQILFEMEP